MQTIQPPNMGGSYILEGLFFIVKMNIVRISRHLPAAMVEHVVNAAY